MKEKKQSNNKGCLITLIIGVILYLIYVFSTKTSIFFADVGECIMELVGCAICAYILVCITSNRSKKLESQSKEEPVDSKHDDGCLIPLLITIAVLVIGFLIVTTFSSSFSLNQLVGKIVFIAFVIGIALFIYSCIDDK